MHRALILAVLLGGAAAPALAQQVPEPQAETETEVTEGAASPLSFNLGVSSDYVFRGVSQTGGDPQVFGGADYEQDRFYLGAWTSNVDYGDGDELELDLYGGWTPEILGFELDVGALYYAYPGSDTGYVEGKAAATRTLGRLEAGGALYWAPDTNGRAGEGLYYEANGELKLHQRLSVSGALGRQEDDESGAYNTWNLGAQVGLTERISFDARYHDTDADTFGRDGEGRVVAGLKAEF